MTSTDEIFDTRRALRHEPGPFAAVAFSNGWEAAFAEPTLHITEHLQLREPPGTIWYAATSNSTAWTSH